MKRLKFILLFCFVCILFSILFFIPAERTGFVTQVKSQPRAFIGFLFAIIAIAVFVASRGKKETLEQLVYEKGPQEVAKYVLRELKIDPYRQPSSADLYTIVKTVGKGMHEKTLKDMREYVQQGMSEKYQQGEHLPTTTDIAMMCLYYRLRQTQRYRESGRKEKGKRFQI